MPPPRSRGRAAVRLSALLSAALAVTGTQLLLTPAAQAEPDGSGLVINEVYGAGGNSGALLNADFVELLNPSDGPLSLNGLVVQYRSPSGGVGGTQALPDVSVAPGEHYLIQMSAAGSNGAALPTPDLVASPAIGMGATGGQVILGTLTSYGSGDLSDDAGVVDMVGASGATSFEGTVAAAVASTTKSLSRDGDGADTDDNAADFTAQDPTPGAANPTAPDVTITAIKDIQGTGASSPLVGDEVTTQGEVTASFPTGGFNGFYIQTPGADTAEASDGIFVFGGSALTSYPTVGQSVRVTGTVSEYFGLTQVTVGATGVSVIGDLPGAVTPKTQIPLTNCTLGSCPDAAGLDAAREVVEAEAFQPTAPWTATDVYDGGPEYNNGSNSGSNFGELALAADSATPLVAPTEVVDAQDTAAVAARTAYNNARRLILDDGSSTNFSSVRDQALPWFTQSYAPRVGAAVTFPAPVVLSWGFNQWRVLPRTRVVGRPSSTQPQFEQTRAAEARPQAVGGQLQLATFNVLNFFPTTGEEYVASGLGQCTYYTDRDGEPITTNNCGSPSTGSGNGPRGAADDENLARQRTKIVAAINATDADVVSLEELENSVKFGKDRDFAITRLVEALNADAGAGTWAFVPSPPASELPPLEAQDVIRTGFIYRPSVVSPVGASDVLTGDPAFSNARQPLAQAFKPAGRPDAESFAVIVNHFKSKGSGVDDGTGQGNANPDRINQATSLVAFADQFKAARGLTRVFLAGDFNAYTEEDPIQVLNAAGYTNLESTTDPEEESYSFDGQIGSLDHVLANGPALATVTGVDIWTINAYESIYYEYSRYNYNVTELYDASPFRSSDHNPEIVGLTIPQTPTPPPPAKQTSTVTAEVATDRPRVDRKVRILVAVTGASSTPSGTITVEVRGQEDQVVPLVGGTAGFRLDAFGRPGRKKVTITYTGDAQTQPSSTVLRFKVKRR